MTKKLGEKGKIEEENHAAWARGPLRGQELANHHAAERAVAAAQGRICAVPPGTRKTAGMSCAARVNWLMDFAECDADDDDARDRARWEIFAIGAEGKLLETSVLVPGDGGAPLLPAQALEFAPEVDAGRVNEIKAKVRDIIRGLRNDRLAVIEVTTRYSLKRWGGYGSGVNSAATGDVESRFFRGVIKILESASPHLMDCPAPNCQRLFMSKRTNQRYCSVRCQNRAGAARFRQGKT